ARVPHRSGMRWIILAACAVSSAGSLLGTEFCVGHATEGKCTEAACSWRQLAGARGACEQQLCAYAEQAKCEAHSLCEWSSSTCSSSGGGVCRRVPCADVVSASSEAGCSRNAQCEWTAGACRPAVCSTHVSEQCCAADTKCQWDASDAPGQCARAYCFRKHGTSQAACEADTSCHWNPQDLACGDATCAHRSDSCSCRAAGLACFYDEDAARCVPAEYGSCPAMDLVFLVDGSFASTASFSRRPSGFAGVAVALKKFVSEAPVSDAGIRVAVAQMLAVNGSSSALTPPSGVGTGGQGLSGDPAAILADLDWQLANREIAAHADLSVAAGLSLAGGWLGGPGGRQRAVVLLLSSAATDGGAAKPALDQLRADGVHVFAVGVHRLAELITRDSWTISLGAFAVETRAQSATVDQLAERLFADLCSPAGEFGAALADGGAGGGQALARPCQQYGGDRFLCTADLGCYYESVTSSCQPSPCLSVCEEQACLRTPSRQPSERLATPVACAWNAALGACLQPTACAAPTPEACAAASFPFASSLPSGCAWDAAAAACAPAPCAFNSREADCIADPEFSCAWFLGGPPPPAGGPPGGGPPGGGPPGGGPPGGGPPGGGPPGGAGGPPAPVCVARACRSQKTQAACNPAGGCAWTENDCWAACDEDPCAGRADRSACAASVGRCAWDAVAETCAANPCLQYGSEFCCEGKVECRWKVEGSSGFCAAAGAAPCASFAFEAPCAASQAPACLWDGGGCTTFPGCDGLSRCACSSKSDLCFWDSDGARSACVPAEYALCPPVDIAVVIDASFASGLPSAGHPNGLEAVHSALRRWIGDLPLTGAQAGDSWSPRARLAFVQAAMVNGSEAVVHAPRAVGGGDVAGLLSGDAAELADAVTLLSKEAALGAGATEGIAVGLREARELLETPGSAGRRRAVVVLAFSSGSERFAADAVPSEAASLRESGIETFVVHLRRQTSVTASDAGLEASLSSLTASGGVWSDADTSFPPPPRGPRRASILVGELSYALASICKPASPWGVSLIDERAIAWRESPSNGGRGSPCWVYETAGACEYGGSCVWSTAQHTCVASFCPQQCTEAECSAVKDTCEWTGTTCAQLPYATRHAPDNSETPACLCDFNSGETATRRAACGGRAAMR
ncbi:hypothetical protein DIPPA_03757, partial [Diplonema papillatum]